MMNTQSLEQQLKQIRVLPVVTPHSAKSTIELAKALLAGGITGIEITLRNDSALDALAAVKNAQLGITVGVGTITESKLVYEVAEIGVDFAVSPGLTKSVLDSAKETNLPLLPGVSSPSEIMLGLEYGIDFFKLFPAGALNGTSMLKALSGPFPSVKFCPTGGVSLDNANDYLRLSNVVCVGGSWMVPGDLIKNQQWEEITDLSKAAMQLTALDKNKI